MKSSDHIRSSLGFLDLESVTELGELEISENGVDFYRMPIAFLLHTYYKGDEEWVYPEYFTIREDCELIEVITHSSRRIYLQIDEKVTALDTDLNFMKQSPQIGLCVPRYQLGWRNNAEDYSMSIPFLKKEAKYEWYSTLKLDEKIGWLIGVYVGDGWTDFLKGKNAVNLANRNQEIVRNVRRIITSMSTGEIIHFSTRDSHHEFEGRPAFSQKLIFSSRSWATFFSQNIGHGAKNKHLPKWWQVAGSNFRWGILAGLIDTDGTVAICHPKTKPRSQIQISYHTISIKLANEVVELAHSLGLVATVTRYKTPKDKVAFNIVFNKESIFKMQQRLKLREPKRKVNLATARQGNRKGTHKYSPWVSTERLIELCESLRVKNLNIQIDVEEKKFLPKKFDPERLYALRNSIGRVIGRREGSRGALIYDTAIEIIDLGLNFIKTDPFWMRWEQLILNESFGWEIIVDIKQVEEKGVSYGFVLPDGHSAITGSGLLT